MHATTTTHPVQFHVDHPQGQRNRLSTALRLLFAIPALAVLAALGGPSLLGSDGDWLFLVGLASGLVVIPPLLTIVVRQKYPRWWFDFNLAFLRFDNRVTSYLLLLADDYPSTDDEQAVHLDMPYPEVATDLNRWLPLVKWFLAIPHYVALLVLDVAVVFAVVASWLAIVVTGRQPRRLFDFTVGVMRWHNRVVGYAFVLATDQYPPFRLSA